MLKKSTLSKTWFRCILLAVIFFFLALLFVSPAVKYSSDADFRNSGRPLKLDAGDFKSAEDREVAHKKALSELPLSDPKTDELMKIEHQKAIDEIKLRLEQQDSWYHYKFLIIGGLFALFLGQTGLAMGRSSPSGSQSGRELKTVLTAVSNYSILALAVVISLAIDMHIRNNMFGVQTLGLWIANYVEPSYPSTFFFPWEQYLRNIKSESIHLDSLYRLGFSLHLHFMTIAVYLLYVIVLQQICLTSNQRSGVGRKQIVVFGFLLVHLAALAFVFVAHAVPGAYIMNLIPLEIWETGWRNVGYYLIPLLVLVALNLPYLLLLRERQLNASENSNATL